MKARLVLTLALSASAGASAFLACSYDDSPKLSPYDDASVPGEPPDDDSGYDGRAPQATERSACIAYVTAECEKSAECSPGTGTTQCLHFGDLCPEYFFAPGSTRTVDGLIACAGELRGMSCERYRAGVRPSCATPGKLAAGAPCISPTQCASQSCNGLSRASCGACSAVYELDEECTGEGTSGAIVCPQNQKCDPTTKRCAPIAVPAVLQAGATCTASASAGVCAAGTSCIVSAPGAASGTCGALPETGAPCALVAGTAQMARCAEDAYCKYSDAQGTAGTCIAAAKLGDACTYGADGTPTLVSCEKPAYCHFTTSTTGTCRAPAALGEACGPLTFAGGTTTIPCGAGAGECAAATDGGAQVCKTLLGRSADCSPPGAQCHSLLSCTGGKCEPLDYATCSASDGGSLDATTDASDASDASEAPDADDAGDAGNGG